MAEAFIRFDLAQLAALNGMLADAHARSQDLTPLMDQIGNAAELTIEERFASQSGPDGRKWTPSQRVLAFGGQTLTLGGYLRDSITHNAGPNSVEVGSGLVYARPHQMGFGEGNLPARPYLGVGGDDEETWSELTADYLLGGLAG
jgi:phage virion morphogenesis protein